jgi:hypothetical protein
MAGLLFTPRHLTIQPILPMLGSSKQHGDCTGLQSPFVEKVDDASRECLGVLTRYVVTRLE